MAVDVDTESTLFDMILMTLLTHFKGRSVGVDSYGNKYFEEKFLFSKPNRAPRRWVTYKGEAEPSKIPPEWHGWLHFTYEKPLAAPPHSWQKKHLRNLTGTPFAFAPPTSTVKLATQYSNVKKPYDAWDPDKQAPIEASL